MKMTHGISREKDKEICEDTGGGKGRGGGGGGGRGSEYPIITLRTSPENTSCNPYKQ
jgi:hypothetical protein